MVTELTNHTTVQHSARSIVETSIGQVTVWAYDQEYPDSPSSIGIRTVAGDPHGKTPAAGEPPYLHVSVNLCRGRWELTFGWVRNADALLTMNSKEAENERREYKRLGIVGIKIRALPLRSPLRHELVEVAAKWAAEHPEAFEQERRATYLDAFAFSVEQIAESLENMITFRKDLRPLLSGAERVGLVTPAVRNETDKAVKALEAAISAAKEAKRLFASGGVMAARQ